MCLIVCLYFTLIGCVKLFVSNCMTSFVCVCVCVKLCDAEHRKLGDVNLILAVEQQEKQTIFF